MSVSMEIVQVYMLRPDQVQAMGGLCTYLEEYEDRRVPLFISHSLAVPNNSERRLPPFPRPLYWHTNTTNEPQPVRWAYQFGSHLVGTRPPPSIELAEFCAIGVSLLDRTYGRPSAKRFKVKEVPMALAQLSIARAYVHEPLISFRRQLTELHDMFNAEADSKHFEL